MKNYVVPILFIAVVAICFAFVPKKGKTNALAVEYRTYFAKEEDIPPSGFKAINNLGFCYEVVTKQKLDIAATQAMGQSQIILCSKSDVNKILEECGFVLKDRYMIGEILVFEGATKSGQRMQAAFSKGKLTVGCPVIFGSY